MPIFFDAVPYVGISRVIGQAVSAVGGLFAWVERVIRYANQQHHSVDFNLGPHTDVQVLNSQDLYVSKAHGVCINKMMPKRR